MLMQCSEDHRAGGALQLQHLVDWLQVKECAHVLFEAHGVIRVRLFSRIHFIWIFFKWVKLINVPVTAEPMI